MDFWQSKEFTLSRTADERNSFLFEIFFASWGFSYAFLPLLKYFVVSVITLLLWLHGLIFCLSFYDDLCILSIKFQVSCYCIFDRALIGRLIQTFYQTLGYFYCDWQWHRLCLVTRFELLTLEDYMTRFFYFLFLSASSSLNKKIYIENDLIFIFQRLFII